MKSCLKLVAFGIVIVAICPTTWGDIFRWDTGEVIPDTEGIDPGPGVQLDDFDLTNADLSKLDLTEASFARANLTNARLSLSTLAGANLTGAIIRGADLSGATIALRGFTKEQLYSTSSYQARDLQGLVFHHNDLGGWDLSEQNLTNSHFVLSSLRDANLEGANLSDALLSASSMHGANFSGATIQGTFLDGSGFTKEQLYSTASYQDKNLMGVTLFQNLHDWDLSRQNLLVANLRNSDLTNVNLAGANLIGVDLSETDLKNTNLAGAILMAANLNDSTVTDVNLAGANLKYASFDSDFTSTEVDGIAFYNQETRFSPAFDPVAAGFEFQSSPEGDVDTSPGLGVSDIDVLAKTIRLPLASLGRLSWFDYLFDLNGDNAVDQGDHQVWVRNLKQTWFGDANLDGEFNSGDLVAVFGAGEYEDALADNSGWAEGDWDGDGDFTSGDLVVAFQDGGYEKGPRIEAIAVPEPSSFPLPMAALIGIAIRRRSVVA